MSDFRVKNVRELASKEEITFTAHYHPFGRIIEIIKKEGLHFDFPNGENKYFPPDQIEVNVVQDELIVTIKPKIEEDEHAKT